MILIILLISMIFAYINLVTGEEIYNLISYGLLIIFFVVLFTDAYIKLRRLIK